MSEFPSTGRQEQRALVQSVAVTLCISLVGVGFGVLSGSFSILFDGVYALIDASVAGLALLAARLIHLDAEDQRAQRDSTRRLRYQLGFWHLEPMVLALNATLLMLTATYALASSVMVIFEGGTRLSFGPAILYAAVVSSLCFFMSRRQRKLNRDIKSGFLTLDAKTWTISGTISLSLLAAFGVGAALEGTALEPWQAYVDPAILALVCLVLLPMPLSDLRAAVADLLLRAPGHLDAQVRQVAQDIATAKGFDGFRTYVGRMGRSRMIEVHFIAPPGWPVTGLAQLDAIRNEVGAAIGGEGPDRWLTICFTEDPEWAA